MAQEAWVTGAPRPCVECRQPYMPDAHTPNRRNSAGSLCQRCRKQKKQAKAGKKKGDN